MKRCDNVTELARELGIRRKWLYEWSRHERVGGPDGDCTEETARAGQQVSQAGEPPAEAKLRKQVQELESLVARQNLEIDFFKGALQRIGQRRGKRKETTASASTNKSEA
jgi:hypothetical protein